MSDLIRLSEIRAKAFHGNGGGQVVTWLKPGRLFAAHLDLEGKVTIYSGFSRIDIDDPQMMEEPQIPGYESYAAMSELQEMTAAFMVAWIERARDRDYELRREAEQS
jgi:hypothetical protein